MNYAILFMFISFSLFNIDLINLLVKNKLNNDTLYFLISNMILGISIIIFYFYYKDLFISLLTSFLYMLNQFFIIRELKIIKKKYSLLRYILLSISLRYVIFATILSLSSCEANNTMRLFCAKVSGDTFRCLRLLKYEEQLPNSIPTQRLIRIIQYVKIFFCMNISCMIN